MVYYCNLMPDLDSGGFVATFPDIPGVVTEGNTKDEALFNAWELRKLRGNLPQSEIAKRLGLTYQAYQRLENPIKGNPTIKTLEKVAKVFGKRLVITMV